MRSSFVPAVATALAVITAAACSSTSTPSPAPASDAAANDAAKGDGGTKCEAAGHFCAATDGSCPAGFSPVGALEFSCGQASPNCCFPVGAADAGKD